MEGAGLRSCRCGCCSGQFGRRLDLVEAKVLSHWHEFVLYKSEAQRKFEDLFARRRHGGRLPAERAERTELERRVLQVEEKHAERLEELREAVGACVLREDLGRLWQEQGYNDDRLNALLEQRNHQLQGLVANQVAELRAEVEEVLQKRGEEVTQHIQQGHEDLLRLAQTVAQHGVTSAMVELTSEVAAAESRADQQVSRLRSELETAEAAAQEACARNANEISRAVDAADSVKPRLQQANAEARAAVTCLEISVEKRMQCFATGVAEDRGACRERLDQLFASQAELEQLLQKQDINASDSRSNLEVLERRFQSQGQRHEELQRSFSQLRTELSERADALESRLEAEVTGCKDEVQEQLANHSQALVAAREAQTAAAQALREACEAKGTQQELEDGLQDSQERVTTLAATMSSLQDAMVSFNKKLSGLMDSQKFLQQSFANVQVVQNEGSKTNAANAKVQELTEEASKMQAQLRSLTPRVAALESGDVEWSASVKVEVGELRAEVEELSKRRAASVLQAEKVEADLSQRLAHLEHAKGAWVQVVQNEGSKAKAANTKVQELVEETSKMQAQLRALTPRVTGLEAAVMGSADWSAISVKAEVAQLRLEVEELSKRRAASALQTEKMEADLSQRLALLECGKGAWGEAPSTPKLSHLAQQVEAIRSASAASEGLFCELKTTIMRVEDLQVQVNRLSRDSKKGSEKIEGAVSRLQDMERTLERLSKARESSELWREVRELRSQISELRLQGLIRSPRSGETQRLGWLEP
ncbi:unnamed protein product [Durusdinium trenchii]|uniref:Uncharacterized protein n=3 Tax=Durusdinium trenchii TaxID=1381693 RepID=A0ABP0NQR9_9DINO